MIATKELQPPIKWHGGKHYLAPKIIALMPPHVHYVEPYFGGGAVLLAKNPESVSEVVNDLNGSLTGFWWVLRHEAEFQEFIRKVTALPFSEAEWNEAGNEGCSIVDRAVRFFVRARQSRQGLMKDFATLSRNRTRRGMNEQVSSWLTAIEGLPEVHARLKRVVILNQDALKVIDSQDGPNTLFYLDPPYLHETRTVTEAYAHEMTSEQHEALLSKLGGIDGKFMLSGYPSKLYERHAAGNGWGRHDFDLPNNAASGDSKRRMTECVWCNF